jgi:hypothetical protein
MKRLIAEIPFVPYGFRQDGNDYSCEPSHQEIQCAIDKGQLEDRGFQTHLDELRSEWASNARSLQEFADRQREYNARRIAYFVVHGWTDPITLTAAGNMRDGLHRLKAAIFLGKDEVEVIVLNDDVK